MPVRKVAENVIICLLLMISLASAFLPTPSPGDSSSTHSDITRNGVNQAIHYFLRNRSLVSVGSNDVIADFFQSDDKGKNKYYKIVKKIGTANNNIHKNKGHLAKYTVNGEQIQQAHDLITKERIQIKGLASKPATEDILSMIRKKIGKCLFVIQSFYSNTNWVNMAGPTVYKDFGVPGKRLEVTPRNIATCSNCLKSGRCSGSLLIPDKLTSGYRSGQDISKPTIPGRRRGLKGKCSHGGTRDTTRTTRATGGINKETNNKTLSPMYDLHDDAATAATDATIDFLTGQYGIVNEIGDINFRKVFHLLPRQMNTSLTFVVDVSASMEDDVKVVLQKTKEIVNSLRGTDKEPSLYILSTFSDPESKSALYQTDKGYEMIAQLSSLTVSGGDDCPEYAMSGLIQAINTAYEDSSVYLFTDAWPKDCNKLKEVLQSAKAKNIKIDSLLTGACPPNETKPCVITTKRSVEKGLYFRSTATVINGRVKEKRKKRAKPELPIGHYHTYGEASHTHLRVKRSDISTYYTLARETGGAVHKSTKEGLSSILDQLIEEDFPLSEILINRLTSSQPEKIPVYVDSGIQLLKIQISGMSYLFQASLMPPSEEDKSDLTRYQDKKTGVITFSVSRPKLGQWTLHKVSDATCRIQITAQASFSISYRLLETDSSGLAFPITGNPIAGQSYTIEITISDKISFNNTDMTVVVMDETGSELISQIVSFTVSEFGSLGNMQFTMPPQKVLIQINGLDEYNNVFQRTAESPIEPVSVYLQLLDIEEVRTTRRAHTIPYTVSNVGAGNQSLSVLYTDTTGHRDSVDLVLTGGESKDGNFTINGASDGDVIKYTVTVIDADSRSVLQSLFDFVVFTDTQHPECTVLHILSTCTNEHLNIHQCSKATWETTSQVWYFGVNITSIYLSNHDDSVRISHDDVTGNPINVSVRGSCCAPSVYLNIIDTEIYSARCHFYFGDPYQITASDTEETEEDDDTDISTEGLVIIGVVCGVVCLWIVFLVIRTLLNARKKKQYSLQPSN